MNNYINILNDIYNSIYENNIELLIKKIKELIKNKNSKYEYLNMMLNPDVYKFTKIPNIVELPTCTFYYHNYVDYKLGNDGLCSIIINPYFLYYEDLYQPEANFFNRQYYNNRGSSLNSDEVTELPKEEQLEYYSIMYLSTFYSNNNIKNDPNDYRYSINNLNQTVPRLYNKYRLVSSCVSVTYTSKISDAKGRIGCSISLDNDNFICGKVATFKQSDSETIYIISTDTFNQNLSKYNSNKVINNSFYSKINPCIKGIKMVYFPPDNSYEQFIKPIDYNDLYFIHESKENFYNLKVKKNYKNGFKFVIQGFDLPAESTINIDISCNYECIPNPEYMFYLPINSKSIYLDDDSKRKMILKIMDKPIFNIDENININDDNDWEYELRKIDIKDLEKIGTIYAN